MNEQPPSKSFLALLLITAITAAIAIVGTLLFVGLGSLLAWLSPLTFFQALCVTIGSAIAMSVVAHALMASPWRMDDDDEYEDELDDDFDAFEEEAGGDLRAIDVTEARPETRPQTPKVGRNEPCPCGSGKKYKHCCGA